MNRLLVFSLFAAHLLFGSTDIASAQSSQKTISVDEIKPGMKGYGLSVFRGTQPERFEIEVIDVLHNFRPDQDLILVRTYHPILKHAKVVAGMSGSPVYINDRLAGAYAYGWTFGNDPMAGVTPIKNMRVEMKRPTRPQFGEPGHKKGKQAIAASIVSPTRTAFSALAEATPPQATNDDSSSVFHATTPVSLGGFTDDVARFLGEKLQPFGLHVLQAGGGGEAPSDAPKRFENGSSIAVQLIRGDISMAGTGTVTEVDGKRLSGFGHPMMNAGEVRLPVATSKVLHILSSQRSSFKIAEALEPMGTLIHDRQSAIVVDTKQTAPVIPVRVAIKGVRGAPKTEWNAEVAVHERLTPLLVFSAMANAISATESGQEPVVVDIRSEVDIKGHGTLRFHDSGFTIGGPSDMGTLGSARIFPALEAALLNPFEQTSVDRVDLQIGIRYGREATEILGASLGQGEVDPGSRVPVFVRVRHLDEPEHTEVMYLDIPKRAAGETLKVSITSGSRTPKLTPTPDSLEGIFEAIAGRYGSHQMVATIKAPSSAFQFRGHVVSDLPHSVANALHLTHNTSDNGKKLNTTTHVVKNTDSVLFGKADLTIRVREQAKEAP